MNAQAQMLSSFEWLGREMRAKTATYEASITATGEKPPSWDEKMGVFGKLENDLQKDLAYILATGDYAENTAERKRVEDYLFKSIFAVADVEKTHKKDKLPDVCRMIAKMELFFFLYDYLEDDFTLQGRLRMAGLLREMAVKTYQNSWKHYGDALRMMLDEAKEEADEQIKKYKKELFKNG